MPSLTFTCRTAVRKPGTSGARSSADLNGNRISLVICPIPGWERISSGQCLIFLSIQTQQLTHLIIGAGLPHSWLQGEGIRVRGLRTPYGEISYAARDESGQVRFDLEGSTMPPGGFVVPASLKGDVRVTFNGNPVHVPEDSLIKTGCCGPDCLQSFT